MAHVRQWWFAMALLGCSHRATPAHWYEATPLLDSLRTGERAPEALAHAAGVAHLEDLPLYDLDVAIDPAAASFTLREDVYFTNTTATALDELVLRVYADATPIAHTPPVTLTHGQCVDALACTVREETPGVIVVHPAAPIAAGARVHARLALRGTLERIDADRTGLLAQGLAGLSSLTSGDAARDYGLLSVSEGVASLANFYGVVAARRDGRWQRTEASTMGDLGSDEMSHVRATITLHGGGTIVTSGIASDAPARHETGSTVATVHAAMVRDFAIVAGAGLATATRSWGDVTVRSHFLAADREAGERVLDVAVAALDDLQRRFGPYPYTDFDVAEAPLIGGAGGVEFAGMVTVANLFYRPATLGAPLGMLAGALGDDNPLTGYLRATLEFVTAHEVAHQWWHGLVGSDSRGHPFLDEGLAQYSAMLYLEDRYGAARAQHDGDIQVRASYQMMRLLGNDDDAVDRPVAAFGSPVAYAGLVYGKGPYVYGAYRRALGDAAFFDGLRAYVTRYRLRVAPRDALVETLAAQPGGNAIRPLATRWLQQAHGDEDLGRADLGALMRELVGSNGQAIPTEFLHALEMLSAGHDDAPDAEGALLEQLRGALAP